jgi:hypothetical protein
VQFDRVRKVAKALVFRQRYLFRLYMSGGWNGEIFDALRSRVSSNLFDRWNVFFYNFFFLNRSFEVSRGIYSTGISNGIQILNLNRQLVLKVWTKRQNKEWISHLKDVANNQGYYSIHFFNIFHLIFDVSVLVYVRIACDSYILFKNFS